MTEVPTPQTDAILSVFGSRLGLDEHMAQTLRAEETAARVESVWNVALPFMLQTPDYAQRLLAHRYADDWEGQMTTLDFQMRRARLWQGNAERAPMVVMPEEVVIRALHSERQAGQREVVDLINRRAQMGGMAIELVLMDSGPLPPLPRGFTLFWDKYSRSPWDAFAVSIDDGRRVEYSEEPSVIMAYTGARRSLYGKTIDSDEGQLHLDNLEREIHPYPDPPLLSVTGGPVA
jgi:hypothetical protein